MDAIITGEAIVEETTFYTVHGRLFEIKPMGNLTNQVSRMIYLVVEWLQGLSPDKIAELHGRLLHSEIDPEMLEDGMMVTEADEKAYSEIINAIVAAQAAVERDDGKWNDPLNGLEFSAIRHSA